MGFVSFQEDIEKIRQDHEHFAQSARQAIGQVTAKREALLVEQVYREKLQQMGAIKELDKKASALADQLIERLEHQLEVAVRLKDEAIKFLGDTSLHVSDRIKKVTSQRNELRDEKETLRAQLEKSRQSGARLKDENAALKEEIERLRRALDATRDENALMQAYSDVTPLKR